MIKRSVFESSEDGRTEVTYSALTPRQLEQRIKSYEQKYAMPFSQYKRQFSCDEALPWEVSDYMDWENLLQERAERQRVAKKQPSCRR